MVRKRLAAAATNLIPKQLTEELPKQFKEALLSSLSARLAQKKAAAVPRLIPKATATGFVESFDGTKIYWELHGPHPSDKTAKRPAVFCYGLVCSMNMWRYQIERFSKDRSCILLDYRGHHNSAHPKERSLLNISALAKDVATVIEHLKLPQAPHIWGHSMGTNVAIELAASRPDLCHTLQLLCGTIRNPFKGMFNTEASEKLVEPLIRAYPENREIIHMIWQTAMSQTKIARSVASVAGFNDKASRMEDMEAYVLAVAAIDPATFFPLLIDLSRGMQAAMLPKIKTPTLVMGGSHDLITPIAAQKEMASLLPDGTLVEIPAGSHNAEIDFGEYVCMKAEEFWKKRQLR